MGSKIKALLNEIESDNLNEKEGDIIICKEDFESYKKKYGGK